MLATAATTNLSSQPQTRTAVSTPQAGARPATCLGCCSPAIAKIETVSIDELADAWVASQTHGSSEEEVRRFLRADIGAEQIEFWQCSRCGLEFANPLRSWRDAHYPEEKHSLGFDQHLALKLLAGAPPRRILEIGCADGQFLERAALQGHETVGIDFSEQDVIAARRRGVDAVHINISEFGAHAFDAKFDVLALFQVIEHLTDPNRLFDTIVELAEAGALLLLGCPSNLRYTRTYSHPERLGRSDFWDYPPQHLSRWTPESLRYFLRRFGFEIDEIVYEPLSIVSASAHLTALRGLNTDWYGKRWRRRLAFAPWLLRLTGDRLVRRSTGIRLFAKAHFKS